MPDRVPAPPATLIAQLPADRVAAAIALLATLIAAAATAAPGPVVGDE
jgi:hypothetical protein